MVDIARIESLRKQHGYSQEYMGKSLGYQSHNAYGRKVRGDRDFTVEDIVKLCNLFQLELSDLIIMERVGK